MCMYYETTYLKIHFMKGTSEVSLGIEHNYFFCKVTYLKAKFSLVQTWNVEIRVDELFSNPQSTDAFAFSKTQDQQFLKQF